MPITKPRLADETFYIKPLPGFVVCIPFKEEKDNNSGIFIPDTMSDKDGAGQVVAVGDSYDILEGPQSLKVSCPVKVGDHIIFTNFTRPNYLDFKSGKHIYIVKFHPDPRYSDILAIIKK